MSAEITERRMNVLEGHDHDARETRIVVSGIFFGGGLDHLIYMAVGSSRSHYGLELSPLQQLKFAALDMSIAATLVSLHARWDARRD